MSLRTELLKWNDAIRFQPKNSKAYVRRGMVYFKLAEIDLSIEDFDRAEKLSPELTPYLWQRGLSYYYAERFQEGAKQFEMDLQVNIEDVEETAWRYLCIARLKGVQQAQNTLLPVKNDPRAVMRNVYKLYAGNCSIEDVLSAGYKEGKLGKFYGHLYAGLYCEARENKERAREYIVKAALEYQINDYMWHLACVHGQLRGWT